MELSQEKLDRRDAFLGRAREPVAKSRPLTALGVERGQTNHALQPELHFVHQYRGGMWLQNFVIGTPIRHSGQSPAAKFSGALSSARAMFGTPRSTVASHRS
jgi:hypothetical protein